MLINFFLVSSKSQTRIGFFQHSSPFSTTYIRRVKKRMPPKKQAAAEKKILLGRPSNNLKIGIVGVLSRLTLNSTSVF
jgi:hypothetical protein